MAVSPAPVLAFLGITLNPLTLAKDIANAIFSAALALFGQGAASVVGEVDAALEVNEQLIARQDLPANFNESAKRNRDFCIHKLEELKIADAKPTDLGT
jgi:hypothetical protein